MKACIAVQREQLTRGAIDTGLAGASATIQTNPEQAQRVDANAHGALGKTGGEVELEALPPFFVLTAGVLAFTDVVVEIEIAQAKGGLAVFDETCGAGLLGEDA